MSSESPIIYCKRLSALIFCLALLSGCENESTTDEVKSEQTTVTKAETNTPRISVAPAPTAPANIEVADKDLEIGNTQYLFVAAEHTAAELQALLERVDHITQSDAQPHDELDIALVIHGDNINMFTEKNYEQNKSMIDLAAKLDAFNILDLKICEWSMSQRGISTSDIPSFVEPVPFAPEEIKNLKEAGYINL